MVCFLMEHSIGMHLESVAVIMHLIGATLKFSNQRSSVGHQEFRTSHYIL